MYTISSKINEIDTPGFYHYFDILQGIKNEGVISLIPNCIYNYLQSDYLLKSQLISPINIKEKQKKYLLNLNTMLSNYLTIIDTSI